jgi:hypothetical protein
VGAKAEPIDCIHSGIARVACRIMSCSFVVTDFRFNKAVSKAIEASRLDHAAPEGPFRAVQTAVQYSAQQGALLGLGLGKPLMRHRVPGRRLGHVPASRICGPLPSELPMMRTWNQPRD